MGDQNTIIATADEARHLLRRTGFGAPSLDVKRLTGLTRGVAADKLLNFRPIPFKPVGRYLDDRLHSWIRYMLASTRPLQEKLVLFWHDHFATSDLTVGAAHLMANQNQLLRKFSKGNFKAFVKAINKDAAMIEFLDTVRNRKDEPNENYARELMELFTLGVKDLNGSPNYTQQDIVQIARAFTGWDYNYRTGKSSFSEYSHDYMSEFPERGPKVIFETIGGFSGGRDFAASGESTEDFPSREPDAVIDTIFDHTDTSGMKTVARYITQRLLTFFCHSAPATTQINDIVAQSGFDTSWELTPLLRAIFVNDVFWETAAAVPFTASTRKSVKWPIDYVVTTLRTLKVRPAGTYPYVAGGDYNSLHDLLTNMGQHLFEPPSVFGWDWENSWLNSATLLARYQFARNVAAARGTSIFYLRPKVLVDIDLTDPTAIVNAVTDLLGVTHHLSSAERQALVDYLTDNGLNPTIDLHDADVQQVKLRGLFALVIESPAYQVH